MKNDLAEISTKYSNVPQDEMFYSKGNAYLKFTRESECGWCFNGDSKHVLEIPAEIQCRSDGSRSLADPHTHTLKCHSVFYISPGTIHKSSKDGASL